MGTSNRCPNCRAALDSGGGCPKCGWSAACGTISSGTYGTMQLGPALQVVDYSTQLEEISHKLTRIIQILTVIQMRVQ